MTTPATIVNVLIASPNDTTAFRDAVEQALHEWNAQRASASGIILLPRRWETDAIPALSDGDGQTVINSQLVDNADIVFGVFHLKLGSATPRAASGTAEELGRAHEAGKPVHVYFSNTPLPRDFDREQFDALNEFKDDLKRRGLYAQFDDSSELKDKVKSAIELDVGQLEPTPLRTPPGSGAALRAQFRFEREPDNRGRMRSRRERIEIINDGSVLADEVYVELQTEGDGSLPIIHDPTGPFSIAANGGTASISVLRYAGSVSSARVNFTWSENGVEKQSSHTLSFR